MLCSHEQKTCLHDQKRSGFFPVYQEVLATIQVNQLRVNATESFVWCHLLVDTILTPSEELKGRAHPAI